MILPVKGRANLHGHTMLGDRGELMSRGCGCGREQVWMVSSPRIAHPVPGLGWGPLSSLHHWQLQTPQLPEPWVPWGCITPG